VCGDSHTPDRCPTTNVYGDCAEASDAVQDLTDVIELPIRIARFVILDPQTQDREDPPFLAPGRQAVPILAHAAPHAVLLTDYGLYDTVVTKDRRAAREERHDL
jgi:hypothetical protein